MAAHPRLSCYALLLALTVALGGCAKGPSTPCNIPAGAFATLDVTLQAGDVLAWDWTASGPLEFTITDPSGTDIDDVEGGTSDANEVTAAAAGAHTMSWWNFEDMDASMDLAARVNGQAVDATCQVDA